MYARIGLISGSVIFPNICLELAPSILAASKRQGSTPMMAAIRIIVVLPNHIRKFIRAINPLAPATSARNLYVGNPILLSMLLIGP